MFKPNMRSIVVGNVVVAVAFCLAAVLVANPVGDPPAKSAKKTTDEPASTDSGEKKLEVATFGAGCFWCVEAVFQRVEGVEKVVSGYSGGNVKDPTYEEVCTGTTNHAEVCQITYDPSKVTFAELLEVFWKTHDPTTLNQQGADYGTQYRSVVFYHNDEQKAEATKYKEKLDKSGAFPKKIVTEISPITVFYPAEDYHQNYFNENPGKGYCRMVVAPKVEKFKEVFKDKIKKGSE